MRVASPASRTSPATKPARSPISPTVSSSTSSRRPATTTVAPAAASSIAACLPRFVPPPVTRTTRPSSASGAKISDGPGKRGTQESNLTLRFWRPPCYRYTSPPAPAHRSVRAVRCRSAPSAALGWAIGPQLARAAQAAQLARDRPARLLHDLDPAGAAHEVQAHELDVVGVGLEDQHARAVLADLARLVAEATPGGGAHRRGEAVAGRAARELGQRRHRGQADDEVEA